MRVRSGMCIEVPYVSERRYRQGNFRNTVNFQFKAILVLFFM